MNLTGKSQEEHISVIETKGIKTIEVIKSDPYRKDAHSAKPYIINTDVNRRAGLYPGKEETKISDRFNFTLTTLESEKLISLLVKAINWGKLNEKVQRDFNKVIGNVKTRNGYLKVEFTGYQSGSWCASGSVFVNNKYLGYLSLFDDSSVMLLIHNLRQPVYPKKVTEIDAIFK